MPPTISPDTPAQPGLTSVISLPRQQQPMYPITLIFGRHQLYALRPTVILKFNLTKLIMLSSDKPLVFSVKFVLNEMQMITMVYLAKSYCKTDNLL